jgi:DNA polymerase I-like protein with 3'-5' exonuclease and polymerase domains
MGVKDIGGQWYDVQVAEPLIDENQFKYNLDVLGHKYLGVEKDWAGLKAAANRARVKWKSNDSLKQYMADYLPEEVGPYGERDIIMPNEIFSKQRSILINEGLWDVFELESSLLRVLLKMRLRGVPVDLAHAEQMDRDLAAKEHELYSRLKFIAGCEINIWAAASIATAFDKSGITYPRTIKTKQASFTQDWLKAHPSELAQIIVELRQVAKMRKDFVGSMILGSAINGRIYPQFHPVKHDDGGTVSGRFSSSNPNLQQVPSRHPVYGPMIRGLFVPDKGAKWGKHDYSQQEPRLTIWYAALRKFSGAIAAARRYYDNPDTDYHQFIADLCQIERRPAKDINLGLAYGMGKAKMAAKLGKSMEETDVYLKKYHNNVPFMRALQNELMNMASTRGYIKTLLGRRRRFNRYFPPTYDPNNIEAPLPYDEAVAKWGLPVKRAFVHKALNALIQGSAADMMKKALVEVDKAGHVVYITVHDEIDGPVTSKKQVKEINEIMRTCVRLPVEDFEVPLKVDSFMEKSWGACK